MRKTLEIIALVLTIVASLVASIIFFSGRSSLPALISTSTPTTISSSTPVPTTTVPIVSNVQPDYNDFLRGKGPDAPLGAGLLIGLCIVSFITEFPDRVQLHYPVDVLKNLANLSTNEGEATT